MSKSTLKMLPALMIAVSAALVTQPMRAGAIGTLLVTENSSTSLTALLNGTTSLTVTPNGADTWFINLTGVGGSIQAWAEPDVADFSNVVLFDAARPGQLRVVSEVDAPGALANNTADTMHFTLGGNLLFVTFNDLGDGATVPDTGTTFSLFGVSLMGLGFLRRKLC